MARAADIAIGATAATMPWWALQSQEWFVYIGAVAGAGLALIRLSQALFGWPRRRRGE